MVVERLLSLWSFYCTYYVSRYRIVNSNAFADRPFDLFVQLSVGLIAARFLDLFARRNPQIMNERNRVFKETLGFEGIFR